MNKNNNTERIKMSVENDELNKIGAMVLDEWSVSQFISAIDDYDIDIDIRGSHIEKLCRAIMEDKDE